MAFGEGVRGACLAESRECPASDPLPGDRFPEQRPFSVSPKVRQHAVKTAFTVLSPHASLFHLRPACAGGPLQAATMPLSHEGTDEHASGFRRFMFLRRIFGTTRVKDDSAILWHSRDSRAVFRIAAARHPVSDSVVRSRLDTSGMVAAPLELFASSDLRVFAPLRLIRIFGIHKTLATARASCLASTPLQRVHPPALFSSTAFFAFSSCPGPKTILPPVELVFLR